MFDAFAWLHVIQSHAVMRLQTFLTKNVPTLTMADHGGADVVQTKWDHFVTFPPEGAADRFVKFIICIVCFLNLVYFFTKSFLISRKTYRPVMAEIVLPMASFCLPPFRMFESHRGSNIRQSGKPGEENAGYGFLY
jgi:hypothetical protein